MHIRSRMSENQVMTRTSHELCNLYRVEFLSDRTLKRFFKRSDVEIDSGKGSSLHGSGVGDTGYSHFISFRNAYLAALVSQ